MNKNLILTTALLTTLIIPTMLNAQEEATDEAVQDIRDAVKQKVEERLDSINQRQVGLVGQVSEITDTQINITTRLQDYIITTNEDTEFQKVPGRTAIEREDIAIEDYILIKGTQETGQETIKATTIQVIPEPNVPDRRKLTGNITDITTSNITITDQEGEEWTIDFDQNTDFFIKNTDITQDLDSDELIENDQLVIIGNPVEDEDNQLDALIIIQIPSAQSQ